MPLLFSGLGALNALQINSIMSLSGHASLKSRRESQGAPELWRKGFVFVCFSFKLWQCFHLKTAHKKMLTYKVIAENLISLQQNSNTLCLFLECGPYS